KLVHGEADGAEKNAEHEDRSHAVGNARAAESLNERAQQVREEESEDDWDEEISREVEGVEDCEYEQPREADRPDVHPDGKRDGPVGRLPLVAAVALVPLDRHREGRRRALPLGTTSLEFHPADISNPRAGASG